MDKWNYVGPTETSINKTSELADRRASPAGPPPLFFWLPAALLSSSLRLLFLPSFPCPAVATNDRCDPVTRDAQMAPGQTQPPPQRRITIVKAVISENPSRMILYP